MRQHEYPRQSFIQSHHALPAGLQTWVVAVTKKFATQTAATLSVAPVIRNGNDFYFTGKNLGTLLGLSSVSAIHSVMMKTLLNIRRREKICIPAGIVSNNMLCSTQFCQTLSNVLSQKFWRTLSMGRFTLPRRDSSINHNALAAFYLRVIWLDGKYCLWFHPRKLTWDRGKQ